MLPIRKVARGVGITKKIGWHTFRHTCATLLRASGADIKVVLFVPTKFWRK
jgi:site-specific recombinase XerD